MAGRGGVALLVFSKKSRSPVWCAYMGLNFPVETWTYLDLNQGPSRYKRDALTTELYVQISTGKFWGCSLSAGRQVTTELCAHKHIVNTQKNLF